MGRRGRPRGRPRKYPLEPPRLPREKETKGSIALSDSEGSDVDMPVRGGPSYPKDDDLIAAEDIADDGEGSESGSDEEDEDVFVVEEIKQHLVDQDVRGLYLGRYGHS